MSKVFIDTDEIHDFMIAMEPFAMDVTRNGKGFGNRELAVLMSDQFLKSIILSYTKIKKSLFPVCYFCERKRLIAKSTFPGNS